jgi:transcriptional/translational regulatory protein YebC/TACO1
MMIDVITDNTNRAFSNLRTILTKNGQHWFLGSVAEVRCVVLACTTGGKRETSGMDLIDAALTIDSR